MPAAEVLRWFRLNAKYTLRDFVFFALQTKFVIAHPAYFNTKWFIKKLLENFLQIFEIGCFWCQK